MYSENDWRFYKGGELYHGQWEWPNGNNSKAYNAWYYATHPWKWGVKVANALYNYGKGKVEESKRKAEEEEAARDWYIDEYGVYRTKPEYLTGNTEKPKFMRDYEPETITTSSKPATSEPTKEFWTEEQKDNAIRTFVSVTDDLLDIMYPKVIHIPQPKTKK